MTSKLEAMKLWLSLCLARGFSLIYLFIFMYAFLSYHTFAFVEQEARDVDIKCNLKWRQMTLTDDIVNKLTTRRASPKPFQVT